MFWLVDHAFLSVTGEGASKTDGNGTAALFPSIPRASAMGDGFLMTAKDAL